MNNLDEVVSSILDKISSSIDISDYERSLVKDGILITRKELPTTKTSASNRLSDIVVVCSNYNYLLMKLRTTRLEILGKYRPVYDHKFTVLTRQQRPSKDAIVSEMHYTSPELADMRMELDKLDSVNDFLTMQLSVLDKLYRTIDSRQYSL